MAAGVLFPSVEVHAPGRALLAGNLKKLGAEVHGNVFLSDSRFSGRYKIEGTVKVSGTPDIPVVRRVRLYHNTMACILARETWSAADGSYEFSGVVIGPWFVTAHDHTGEYNAVIADNILGTPL